MDDKLRTSCRRGVEYLGLVANQGIEWASYHERLEADLEKECYPDKIKA